MRKKGQAAMEFLMTYGWAILVVLIALGALFYLGVFSPRVPATCQANAPLSCTDSKVTALTVDVVLGAVGTTTANLDATVGDGGLTFTTPSSGATCTGDPAIAISTSSPTTKQWTGCSGLTAGEKVAGTTTITYTLTGSSLTHTSVVSFQGTVE
jgi:hypothetical protein